MDTWVTSIFDTLQTKLLWAFFVQTSISISPRNRPRRELLGLNYSLGFPSGGNVGLSSKVAAAFSAVTSRGRVFSFLSTLTNISYLLDHLIVPVPVGVQCGVEVHFHGVCRSITSLVQLHRGGKWGTENLPNSHANTWCSHLHVNTMCKGKYGYVRMCVYECLSAPWVPSEARRQWWIPWAGVPGRHEQPQTCAGNHIQVLRENGKHS